MTDLTAESIQTVLTLKPELRDQMVAALDSKIEDLQKVRAEIAGGVVRAKGGRTSAATSGNTMTHGEAVLKVLNSAKFRKNGASSRDIKTAAKDFGHEFGGSLGTTLANLFNKDGIEATQIEGKSQYLYTAAKQA